MTLLVAFVLLASPGAERMLLGPSPFFRTEGHGTPRKAWSARSGRGVPTCYFALVFSSSNHEPFQFPDGRIELYDEEKETVNNAVKYADYAMGEFFRRAKRASYHENTVFLIVSDHDTRVGGAAMMSIDKFHIPGLILTPRLAPRKDSRIVSQFDLPPTLLSLIGVDSEHPMIGRDLTLPFPENQPGRAIMQTGVRHAHMIGNDVVVFRPDKAPSYFRWDHGKKKLTPNPDGDPQLGRTALAHALLPSWLYRERLYFDSANYR